ncbi:LysR family transcriptional regulator [bacterium]|nr:LysR family transcriptional regulator [bacterium]
MFCCVRGCLCDYDKKNINCLSERSIPVMEIYQLKYFVEIAREGNFTKAAERLRIAQPALSQQVKNLESELGAILFNRGRRRSSLTSAGQTLFDHALLVISAEAAAREAVQEVVGLKRGRLVLGTIPSISGYWMPTVIRGFRKKYPEIELILKEASSDEVISMVSGGDAEIGLVQAPIAGEQFDSGLLFEEGFDLLVPAGHALSKKEKVSMKALKTEAFVFYKGRARDSVIEAARKEGFEPRVACESGEIQTVQALVAAGLGVAVLPSIGATPVSKQVQRITLTPRLKRKVMWIARKGGRRSSAAGEFLGMCEGT